MWGSLWGGLLAGLFHSFDDGASPESRACLEAFPAVLAQLQIRSDTLELFNRNARREFLTTLLRIFANAIEAGTE